ncbi:MAG: hypothetical protein PHR61_03355 [Candidatus Absconditabacteria bacterium]|nr:hypothetical protein [Candidatus Absconditabacteria bacterium]
MKAFKSFLIMILGIVIIFSSCKKDEDVKPIPDLILGLEMDQRLTASADSLALQIGEGWIEEEVNVYDPITGELIINPVTGEPETQTVQVPITAERQYGIIANMALDQNWLLCNEIIEYKKINKQRILFSFPNVEETEIISRQTEDGDTYEKNLEGLNDLSAVADNGLTITQMINNIFTNAEEVAVKAAIDYCRERIIYYNTNGSKSGILDTPSDEEIRIILEKYQRKGK